MYNGMNTISSYETNPPVSEDNRVNIGSGDLISFMLAFLSKKAREATNVRTSIRRLVLPQLILACGPVVGFDIGYEYSVMQCIRTLPVLSTLTILCFKKDNTVL